MPELEIHLCTQLNQCIHNQRLVDIDTDNQISLDNSEQLLSNKSLITQQEDHVDDTHKESLCYPCEHSSMTKAKYSN